MTQKGPEKPKLAANMRWFIWAVATLIAINFLIFWKLVVSPSSTGSTPKTPPAPTADKTNSAGAGANRP